MSSKVYVMEEPLYVAIIMFYRNKRRNLKKMNLYHCLFSSLPRLTQPGTLPHASVWRPLRGPLPSCSWGVWRPKSSPSTRLQHGLQSRPTSRHVSAWSDGPRPSSRTGVWWPPGSDLPGPGWGSSCGCRWGPTGARVPHTGRRETSKKNLQKHSFGS